MIVAMVVLFAVMFVIGYVVVTFFALRYAERRSFDRKRVKPPGG